MPIGPPGIPPTVSKKRGKKRIVLFKKKRIFDKKEEKEECFVWACKTPTVIRTNTGRQHK